MAGEDLREEIRRQDIERYWSADSWHCLLAGYGIFPRPEQLRPEDPERRRFKLEEVDDFLRRCALNFKPHREQLGLA